MADVGANPKMQGQFGVFENPPGGANGYPLIYEAASPGHKRWALATDTVLLGAVQFTGSDNYTVSTYPNYSICNISGNMAICPGGNNVAFYAGGSSNPGVLSLWMNTAGNWTLPAPAAGIALTIGGKTGNYALVLNGSSTSANSLGLEILAGTTSADVALLVENQAASATFLEIFGDGHGTLGPSVSSGLSWTSAGIVNVQGGMADFELNGTALQAITPTWTGLHTFSASVSISGAANAVPLTIATPTTGTNTSNAILINYNGSANGYINADGSGVGMFADAAETGAGVYASTADGLYLETNGSARIEISATGLVALEALTSSTGTTLIESGGIIYSLTSSRDYKVDIEDANEAALANVLKLRPVYYRSNPKTTSDRPDWSWYGLIAEEVAEIDPRLVNYWDQGRGCIRKDRKGKETVVRPVQMKPKSVGYERIAPLLIPHINRLYARIEALEAKLKEKSA